MRYRHRIKGPKRRWWQKVLRAGLLVLLVLIGTYVTLPWWAPTGMLCRWLAWQMSQQMQVEVSIDSMKLSWAEGVELRGLRIYSPPGFEKGPMVDVESIRADFSPFNMIANSWIDWMEINHPKLYVHFDKSGNPNINALAKLKLDIKTGRISVRHGIAAVYFPHYDRPICLNVNNLQLLAGPVQQVQRVTMSASLDQDGGPAPVSLQAFAGTDGQPVVAAVTFNFANLDLDQLRLVHLLDLPLQKLGGRCNGSLNLQVNDKGIVERFRLKVDVDGMDVQPEEGPKLPVIERAGFRVSGVIDPDPLAPGGGKIDLRSLKVLLPGIDLGGRATVLMEIQSGSWEAIESLDLVGQIDPSQLLVLLTGSSSLTGGWVAEGPVDVQVRAQRRDDNVKVYVAGEATALAVRRGDRVVKPGGRKLAVRLEGNLDRRKWVFTTDQAEVILGGNSFGGSGSLEGVRGLAARWGRPSGRPIVQTILAELVNLNWRGYWSVGDLHALRDLSPEIEALLADTELRDGVVTGRWYVTSQNGSRIRAALDIPADAHLTVAGKFVKPENTALGVNLFAGIDADRPGLHNLDAELVVGSARFGIDRSRVRLQSTGKAQDSSDKLEVQGAFSGRKLEALLACFPEYRSLSENLRGDFDGRFSLLVDDPEQWQAELFADITDLGVDFGDTWVKSAGQRGKLKLRLKEDPDRDPAQRHQAVLTGTFDQAEIVAEAFFPEGWKAAASRVRLTANAKIAEASWLTASSAAVKEALAGGQLRGPIDVALTASLRGDVVEGHLHCDADATSFVLQPAPKDAPTERGAIRLPQLLKPAGLNASVDLKGKFAAGSGRADVKDLIVRVGDVHLSASGRIDLQREAENLPFEAVVRDGRVAINIRRLETLSRLVPDFQRHALAGSASVDMTFRSGEGEKLARVELALNNVSGQYCDESFFLDGRVLLDEVRLIAGEQNSFGSVETEGLEFRLGKNHGWVVVELAGIPKRPTGHIHLLGETLNEKEIADWLARVDESVGAATTKPTPKGEDAIAQARRTINTARKWLSQASVTANVQVDRFTSFDKSVGQSYEVNNLVLDASVDRGHVKVQYMTGVNGGCVRRKYDVQLTDAEPFLACETRFSDVIATKNIQPQLARFFPGNTVSGYFNREEKIQMPLVYLLASGIDPSISVSPVGTGKTITTDGVVEGRGAPKFVTAIFPGLNLTKYQYNKMTSFSEYRSDGTALNDMIFSGQVYDLYMEGTTDADNIGRYEIGLILLGTPQSAEFNHSLKSGRIPILKIKARIEGGKMHDEEVSYLWPNETLFVIFLKNNIFYRLWLAGKK